MEHIKDKHISQTDHVVYIASSSMSSPGAISKAGEAKHPERSLSPVLNNSNQYRKMINDRRRNRRSNRVKLTYRFDQDNHAGHGKIVPEDERNVNKIYDDLQVLDSNNIEDRLKKIKEFECEKKKFTGCLYRKTAGESQISSPLNDFNFKKPLSPLSGMKRAKSNYPVLIHDRKSTNVRDFDIVKKEVASSVNETISKNENLPVAEPNHMGFSTGAGKTIIVSPENLKKQSGIFNDILHTQESQINRKNFNLHAINVKRSVEGETKQFMQTDSFLGEFHGVSDTHSSQIREVDELHPKDVSFVHPSISDTQMILAADIAMSMMDIPSDDWATPVPNISSDFESKISELNISVQDANDLPFNENSSHNTTVEYEMSELEKVLNQDSVGEILDDNVKSCKDQQKEDLPNCDTSYLVVDGGKVDDVDLHSEAHSNIDCNNETDNNVSTDTETSSAQTIIENQTNLSNDKNNSLKGFSSGEYNLAKNIFRNHDKLIKRRANVINAHSGCTSTEYKEIAAISSNYVLKAATQEYKSNKHRSELVESDTKKCEFNYSEPTGNTEVGTVHAELTTFIPGNDTSNEKVTINFEEERKMDEHTDSKDFETHGLPAQKVAQEPVAAPASFCPMGFSTAAGRNIKISEKAMRRAKTLFTEEDLSSNKFDTEKPFNISKNYKQTTPISDTRNPSGCPVGFSTAGGKSIKISDKAMIRATTIFSEDFSSNKLESNAPVQDTLVDVGKSNTPCVGFSTAAGTSIKISENAMKRTRTIFPDEDLDGSKLKVQKLATFNASKGSYIPSMGFSTAGGSSIKVSERAMKRARTIFTDEDLTGQKLETLATFNASKRVETDQSGGTIENISLAGFSTASGRNIRVPEEATSIFSDEDLYLNNFEPCKRLKVNTAEKDAEFSCTSNKKVGFPTASGTNVKISETTMKKTVSVLASKDLSSASTGQHCSNQGFGNLQQEYIGNVKERQKQDQPKAGGLLGGFSTATGKNIQLSEKNLKRARAIFGDEDLSACLESSATSVEGSEGFSQNMSNKPNTSDPKEADAKDSRSKLCPLNPRKLFSEFQPVTRTDTIPSPARSGSAKKRLGVSFCRQIAISNDRLQKAKLIFQDIDQNVSTNNGNANVSVKQKEPTIYSSTPVKEVASVPAVRSRIVDVESNSLTNLAITPVKRLPLVENPINIENESNSPIIFQRQTEGGVDVWLENINKECEYLERRIKVMLERRKALEEQKKLIESEDGIDRRQILGVLLGKKQASRKLSLKQVAEDRRPGDRRPGDDINASKQILNVTPQNAVDVHFNCNWKNDTNEQCFIVKTTDGAVLIPNAKDVIGFAEIQASFKAMPGVDPKLLPNGWIRNHFKWIVWKLASLERSFPNIFSECLGLENVIQQLKYRYDREIDRAERSALRRITEKDDVPQKRMILCVAEITKISDMFDLELTDGWYSIRTVIDQQLCRQVVAGKIAVGAKLIIQCAEIINCEEGCHPLEIPDNVRLKINYNCTRRAMWHAKLGYQSIAGPFPISLKTIQPDGGIIGCMKVCIARVYPLKYMERQNGRIVWRNNKAEQKRAQEWENQRAKELEIINHKIQGEYENNLNLVQKNNALEKVDLAKISEITSPSLLFHLLMNANDQESFRNKLSSSQFASAMEYQRDMYTKRQEELSTRLSDEVRKLQSLQRDVSPVLKLQVVDANEENDRGFIFSIWKPTEDLVQTLREGCTFSVFNVIPRLNGDLASTSRTHFKLEIASSRNLRVQRYLLPISSVQRMSGRPLFNEYDTVGTAVAIHKNAHHQEMWLTDSAANLLLVKIVEGPERCSLFDSIKRGQNVALMNLIFCGPRDGFGQALANQTTVITSFPQHRLLQTGLETYSEQLPKNLAAFLDDCDKKIEACCMKLEATTSVSSSAFSSSMDSATTSTSYSNAFDDSSEDNTLISSRMTTTDVAMSLIDTDKYFENV